MRPEGDAAHLAARRACSHGRYATVVVVHARRAPPHLRLLAYNAELWLSERLDAYLADPDEIRAITRHLLHQPRTITYIRTTITVTIDRRAQPRVTRALDQLTQELNTNPAHIPGDNHPITYQVKP